MRGTVPTLALLAAISTAGIAHSAPKLPKADCHQVAAGKTCVYRAKQITSTLLSDAYGKARALDIDIPDTSVDAEDNVLWIGLMMWMLAKKTSRGERGDALKELLTRAARKVAAPYRLGGYDWTAEWSDDLHLRLHARRR